MLLAAAAASTQTPAAPAAPAGAGEPAAGGREAAAEAFDQGMALFENENWAGALAAFERAYDLSPHYLVLFNIGHCHRFLGEYPEAIDAYLREGGDIVAPEKREEVERTLAQMRSFVAMVTVAVDEDGAEIVVDGESRGRSPLPEPLALGAGDHVIEALGEAGARAEQRVRLAGGETLQLVTNMLLPAAGAAAAAALVSVTVYYE